MSSRVMRRPTLPISQEQFTSMRSKLQSLGFTSLRESTQGSALRLDLGPEFPGPGREVLTKTAGKSVARFVFNKNENGWILELTLSRPGDERGGMLVEAYPEKKHEVDRKTYIAYMVPSLDEEKTVSKIDDLNVFLAGIDTDSEISNAIDALNIRRRLEKLAGQIPRANSMAEDFLNYMKGFITHCQDL
jgi:choline dehydrogenase-like flavoprotein